MKARTLSAIPFMIPRTTKSATDYLSDGITWRKSKKLKNSMTSPKNTTGPSMVSLFVNAEIPDLILIFLLIDKLYSFSHIVNDILTLILVADWLRLLVLVHIPKKSQLTFSTLPTLEKCWSPDVYHQAVKRHEPCYKLMNNKHIQCKTNPEDWGYN